MQQITYATVHPKFKKLYKSGYPLITKDSFDTKKFVEGDIINIVDEKKEFIAKCYIGFQNKGYGWVLSNSKDEKIDLDFFKNKINKAIKKRENFFNSNDTTAFRVFNAEGDGIGGLSIDYFDGFYLITWYSKGIYKFKDLIIKALTAVAKCKGIYQKRRFNTKGQYLEDSSDFVLGEKAPEPLVIKENGVNFAIYLDDGAMVGIFLDQKDVRKAIKERYAKGKSVLNTFSYTGAFSVAAAVGGASKTTSVDLANRSRAKTQEQFRLNSIDFNSQNIIVEDVFNYFKYAIRKKLSFELVILDPPSFARSKKHTFSASKDYTKLLEDAINITSKNGVIVASTNAANFDMKKFKSFIDRAFKNLKVKYTILETFSLPSDFKVNKNFKEGNYLKVVFIKKL